MKSPDNEDGDILRLNKELLLSPPLIAHHPMVQLLEIGDPGLRFLCPLVKSIYLLGTGKQKSIDRAEALSSVLLGGRWEVDDSIGYFDESVIHRIETSFAETRVRLGFDSSANGGVHDDPYVFYGKDLLAVLGSKSDSKVEEFVENLIA
jgi:hypothetical protein